MSVGAAPRPPQRILPMADPYGPVTELTSIAYVSVANAIASELRSRTSLLLFENVSHAWW